MVAETSSEAASSNADSGTGTRRTTANAERDSVFDRNNQDIGIDEAYQLAGLNVSRSWDANSKLTYDKVLETLDAQVKEAQAFVTATNAVRLQTIATMQVNSDNLQKQHLAHRDIATDRTWNVDEVSALTAKSGVQADAFVAALMSALGDAVKK